MVKLEELEDEHFVEKPQTSKHDILLEDDNDDDYTDTDSEISDASDLVHPEDESLFERLVALKDMVPPQTRGKIARVSSTIYNTTSSTVTYGGKGLWVLATSILLLGLPYALALGDEQQIQEDERQRKLMAEGAQGMMTGGDAGQGGEARAAL